MSNNSDKKPEKKVESGKKNRNNNNSKSNGKASNKDPSKPRTLPPHEGVEILTYIEGRPSPNYLPWTRALSVKLKDKFGIYGDFIDTGRFRKPLQGYDTESSSDDDHSNLEDGRSDSDESEYEDIVPTRAANLPALSVAQSVIAATEREKEWRESRATAKAARQAEQAIQDQADAAEIRKVKLTLRVKARDNDKLKIRDIKPQIFAFIILTISAESFNALKAKAGWKQLRDSNQPIALMSSIAALHFLGHNRNADNLEREAEENLDNCVQGHAEQLNKYKARFEDAIEPRASLGLEEFTTRQLLNKFRKGVDKSRYAKALNDHNLKVEEGILQPFVDIDAFYTYLLRRVPDVAYATQDIKLGTVFAMEDDAAAKKKDNKKGKKPVEKQSGKKATPSADAKDEPPNPCIFCPDFLPRSQRMHWIKDCPGREVYNKSLESKKKPSSGKQPSKPAANVMFGDDDDDDGFGTNCVTLVDKLIVNAFKSNQRDMCIGLDTYANVSMISSPALATDIEDLATPRTIRGVSGMLTINKSAQLQDLGRCLYEPRAKVNVLSHSRVIASPDLDLDYHKEYNTYTVTVLSTGRVLYFKPVDGCYICDLSIRRDRFDQPVKKKSAAADSDAEDSDTEDNCSERVRKLYHTSAIPVCLPAAVPPDAVNQLTAQQLRDLYPKRQLDKLVSVGDLSRKLAFPSNADLAEMVKQGIEDSDVLVSDVHRADRVLGKDAAAVKGKTTKRKIDPIRPDFLPKSALTDQTMHSDLMFVKKTAFLVSVAVPLNLTLATHLPEGKTIGSLTKAFKEQFAVLSAQGFKSKMVVFDGESSIGTVRDTIREMGAELEQLPHGQHVEICERKQRVIKERARSVIHSLFFKLPAILVVLLVYYCVTRINMMPSRLYEDRTSPRENFLGRKLNSKDICLPFGEYVLVHEERQFTNTMEPRAQEAIAVLPLGNLSGSCKFFTLKTHRFITRSSWTLQPVVPDWVRDNLNDLSNTEDPVLPAAVEFEHEVHGAVVPLHDVPEDEPVVPAVPLPVEATHLVPMLQNPMEILSPDPTVVPAAKEILPPQSLRPSRERRTNWKTIHGDEVYQIYNMSCPKALKKHGVVAEKSMFNEVEQLHDRSTFEPRMWSDLTEEQRKAIIPSHMFLKEKFKSTGDFEKLKARLVGGGNKQNKDEYDDVSSPTVHTSSAFMIAAIAAAEERTVATMDITGAYLHAKMSGDVEVLMRLDKTMSAILCKVDPTYTKFLTKSGTLIVKLNKAIYGLIESAKLWYENLSATLQSINFVPNPIDPCVFNRDFNGKQCTACVHVDDLKITCADPAGVEDTIDKLTDKYKTVTVTRGPIHSYLGMTFDYSVKGKVKITMEKFIADLLADNQVTGYAATPATANLFTIDDSSALLDDVQAYKFHSCVASIAYAAKRTKPETLTTIAFLSTRVSAPTQQDWDKLQRLLKYINATQPRGIILEANKNICVLAYIDASYGVHADGKSHTGLVISLGRGTVFVRSAKQKIVSKSSTEAELIGLSDSTTQAIWTRDFLIHQAYEMQAATLYQDNTSTKTMAEKGRSTSDRTRHINIRYFFIKDRIATEEVRIQYLPTKEMIADLLTKPLQGELFRALRQQLTNWDE